MAERTFRLDPSGFPMIKFDRIGGYVSWYPVTKLQFEDFLCRTDQTQFDARWYKRVREKNPRETASRLSNKNYWNAFLTGVSPEEVENYILELGTEYAVISFENWLKVYESAKETEPFDISIVMKTVTNVPMRDLIARIDHLIPQIASEFKVGSATLADQMLLRHGVGEWALSSGQEDVWQIAGLPNPRFHKASIRIDQGQPIRPFQDRLGDVDFSGIRLFRFDDE